jgi:hypothetical protein
MIVTWHAFRSPSRSVVDGSDEGVGVTVGALRRQPVLSHLDSYTGIRKL